MARTSFMAMAYLVRTTEDSRIDRPLGSNGIEMFAQLGSGVVPAPVGAGTRLMLGNAGEAASERRGGPPAVSPLPPGPGDRGHLTQLAEAVYMGRGGHSVMGLRLVKGPAGEGQLTSRETIRLRDAVRSARESICQPG